ncbi:hypothetical protein BUALT_Bualt07G0009100 [Buddleja alternifolia]|uniref:Uncharacterized protein n=1 Tax=Buddleja alternifolia TaxID=168488 RepID=A0AAV6XDY6_9LAMI|nr:hypothetical protein BUALT_Bualt07G0009100 [Buddleja alternifolia]
MTIGHKLGEGLGLTDVSFEKWPSHFRVNKHTFTPENIGSDGLRSHTKNICHTILHEDEKFGGLEGMQRSGKLGQVEPCPRTIIVTLIRGPFSRSKEEVVEAPSELVTSDNPRHYAPFKFEDYWKSKMYKCLDGGQALNPFRSES